MNTRLGRGNQTKGLTCIRLKDKKKIKKELAEKGLFIMISVLLISLFCSGCTFRREFLENRGKEECFLDEEDATGFIYQGQRYTILNEEVDNSDLGEWIGYIQKYVALDHNYKIIKMQDVSTNVVKDLQDLADDSKQVSYYVPFMNIYRQKDAGALSSLIIDVNNAFHRAILAENIKDSNTVIIYSNNSDTNGEVLLSDKPVINKKDFRQLKWKNRTYELTEQTVPNELLGDYIGELSENVVFDMETGKEIPEDDLSGVEIFPGYISNQKRAYRIYGSVYSVNGSDEKNLAVEVNYKYVYAKLKK